MTERVPNEESKKFHWGEANKFALEGFKSLFILSSSSAFGVLAFAAATKSLSIGLTCAFIAFLSTCCCVAIAMIMAYYVT